MSRESAINENEKTKRDQTSLDKGQESRKVDAALTKEICERLREGQDYRTRKEQRDSPPDE